MAFAAPMARTGMGGRGLLTWKGIQKGDGRLCRQGFFFCYAPFRVLFLLYRKLRPIKQKPPGDAHFSPKGNVCWRRRAPAQGSGYWILCFSVGKCALKQKPSGQDRTVAERGHAAKAARRRRRTLRSRLLFYNHIQNSPRGRGPRGQIETH